ncbi:MAG: hypothetical protein KJ002_10510, partial [Candidatus Dadabacteria bacterium]|nr:hypothetical protein [Candidatus Dadabacteria bacterium]
EVRALEMDPFVVLYHGSQVLVYFETGLLQASLARSILEFPRAEKRLFVDKTFVDKTSVKR